MVIRVMHDLLHMHQHGSGFTNWSGFHTLGAGFPFVMGPWGYPLHPAITHKTLGDFQGSVSNDNKWSTRTLNSSGTSCSWHGIVATSLGLIWWRKPSKKISKHCQTMKFAQPQQKSIKSSVVYTCLYHILPLRFSAPGIWYRMASHHSWHGLFTFGCQLSRVSARQIHSLITISTLKMQWLLNMSMLFLVWYPPFSGTAICWYYIYIHRMGSPVLSLFINH